MLPRCRVRAAILGPLSWRGALVAYFQGPLRTTTMPSLVSRPKPHPFPRPTISLVAHGHLYSRMHIYTALQRDLLPSPPSVAAIPIVSPYFPLRCGASMVLLSLDLGTRTGTYARTHNA